LGHFLINALLTLSVVLIAFCVARRDVRLHRKELLYRQANLISVWLTDIKFEDRLYYNVVISNQSLQPIYDVAISVGVIQGSGELFYKENENNTLILTVPHGLYNVKVPYGGGNMNMRFGASISFRDINYNYWRRNANGILLRTKHSPLAELNIKLPANWEDISPLYIAD